MWEKQMSKWFPKVPVCAQDDHDTSSMTTLKHETLWLHNNQKMLHQLVYPNSSSWTE